MQLVIPFIKFLHLFLIRINIRLHFQNQNYSVLIKVSLKERSFQQKRLKTFDRFKLLSNDVEQFHSDGTPVHKTLIVISVMI